MCERLDALVDAVPEYLRDDFLHVLGVLTNPAAPPDVREETRRWLSSYGLVRVQHHRAAVAAAVPPTHWVREPRPHEVTTHAQG